MNLKQASEFAEKIEQLREEIIKIKGENRTLKAKIADRNYGKTRISKEMSDMRDEFADLKLRYNNLKKREGEMYRLEAKNRELEKQISLHKHNYYQN